MFVGLKLFVGKGPEADDRVDTRTKYKYFYT
jgi:hypothetical protein